MKNYLLLLLALGLLASCNREPAPPTPEPTEPIVRNNQMYALVDGEEWRDCGPITAPKTSAQNFIGDYLDLEGVNLCGKGNIYFKIIPFQGEGIYPLGGSSNNLGRYSTSQNFDTDLLHVGTLKITQIDSTERADGRKLPSEISGTFSFVALGQDSTSVARVTDGQFFKIDVYNF